ncbi:MAG: hypothetical protein KDI36_11315 [Pseudomonadales bacterium]|nr:hypothetical protein [Pseudomonadales bacterium]
MDSKTRKLAELKGRMLEAFQQQEWQKLAELDEICRSAIEDIIAADPQTNFHELRGLLSKYHQLISDCEKQRQSYAEQVSVLRRQRTQQRAYSAQLQMSLVS